jgi:hypothetical protein
MGCTVAAVIWPKICLIIDSIRSIVSVAAIARPQVFIAGARSHSIAKSATAAGSFAVKRCVPLLFVLVLRVVLGCSATANASSQKFNTRSLDSRGTVYINGTACNIPCQQYMAWSASVLKSAQQRSSYPNRSQVARHPTRYVLHARAKQHRVASLQRPTHTSSNRNQMTTANNRETEAAPAVSPAQRPPPPSMAAPISPDRDASNAEPSDKPTTQDKPTKQEMTEEKAVAPDQQSGAPHDSPKSHPLPPQPKEPDANAASTRPPDVVASQNTGNPGQPASSTTADQPGGTDGTDHPKRAEAPMQEATAQPGNASDQKDAHSESATPQPQSSAVPAQEPASNQVDDPTGHSAGVKKAEAQPEADKTPTEGSQVTPSSTSSSSPPDTKVADAKQADDLTSRPTINSTAGSVSPAVEEQIEAATALAEKLTLAADHDADQPAAKSSGNAVGKDTPRLIALVLARTDIKSISDLAGKIVAMDERHGGSDRDVRTALVAAGAFNIEIRDGGNNAVGQLVEGQVPAAILTLASQDAANAFPAIAGFNLFEVPLSPPSVQDNASPR